LVTAQEDEIKTTDCIAYADDRQSIKSEIFVGWFSQQKQKRLDFRRQKTGGLL